MAKKQSAKLPKPETGARWFRLYFDDVRGEWTITKNSNWADIPRNLELYDRGLVRSTDDAAIALCDRLNAATVAQCQIP